MAPKENQPYNGVVGNRPTEGLAGCPVAAAEGASECPRESTGLGVGLRGQVRRERNRGPGTREREASMFRRKPWPHTITGFE